MEDWSYSEWAKKIERSRRRAIYDNMGVSGDYHSKQNMLDGKSIGASMGFTR